MKTAISVPDDTYERAERAAEKLGMNRSQFYSTAAARYADELESVALTEAIDAVVGAVNADGSATFAAEASARALGGAAEEW